MAERVLWTDDEKAFAREAWAAGQSAAEIARAFGPRFRRAISRNAVIGAMARADVGRHAPSQPMRTPAPPSPPRPPKPPRLVALPRPEPAPPTAEPSHGVVHAAPACARRTLDLRRGDCKFPVGAATGVEQLHCGRRTAEDEVYCADHRLLAGGGPVAPAVADALARKMARRWR